MSHPPPQLPRTLHSIHPALAGMAAASHNMAGMPGAGLGAVPYPTPEQYAASESAFRTSLAEWEAAAGDGGHEGEEPAPRGAPPVRQPPTLLAALQRPDLTADARRGLLRKLAPQAGPLEKKYKVVFSSDGRRDPLNTPTHDFTVDVTPGVLPPKVHGFELIGYSFPQSEWTLEPGETSIPARHGWCVAPGARTYALVVSAAPSAAAPTVAGLAASGLSASAAALPIEPSSPAAPRVALVAELPLPANPAVRIELLAEEPSSGLPRRMCITFARRVGAVPAAVAASAGQVSLVLEGLAGGYPLPYYAVSADAILDEVVPLYVDAPSAPGPEGRIPQYPRPPQPGDLPAAELAARTLTLVDPALLAWYPSDGVAAEASGDASVPLVGLLRASPPPSAAHAASLISAQLRHLLAHREYFESQTPGAPVVPLIRAHVAWERAHGGVRDVPRGGQGNGHAWLSSRFRLELDWRADEALARRLLASGAPAADVDARLCPFVRTEGDALPQGWGLPAGLPEELGRFSAQGAAWASLAPPQLSPQLTPDAAPVPDNASLEFFFQALNATAASVRFAGQGSGSASSPTFQLPVRDADGTLHLVPVPAGEYRPWGLAAALTRALRAVPALASLRLLASPVFEAGPPNNSVLGFRFESAALPVPQVFGLAFDLPADTHPLVLHPARLGFRSLAYQGQSVYDPRVFSPGAASITFPAAELGLGAPSPLPAVPYFLPAYANRRLQAHLSAPDPVRAAGLPQAEDGAAASLSLALEQPALFRHLQPLSLQASVSSASALRLDGVAGVAESAAPSAALPWSPLGSLAPRFVPADEGAGPCRADAALEPAEVASVLQLLHAPTNTLEGRTLAQTWVQLFGRAGVDYGGGSGPAAQDGDLRVLLQAVAAGADIPTLAQVDALLRRVAAWQDVRASGAALVEAALKVLAAQGEPYPPSTLAGNNGGVSGGVFLSALAAHLTCDRAGAEAFLRDPWGDLYATLLRRSEADRVLSVPFDVLSPMPALLPGERFLFAADVQVTALSAGVLASAVRTSGRVLEIDVGAASGPGPHTVSLSVPALSWAGVVPLVHFHEDGSGISPAAPPSLTPGRPASMSFDDALLALDLPSCAGVVAGSVRLDPARALVYFTPDPNAASVQIAFLQLPLPSVTVVTSTLPLADSALTRLGKLLLVARGGRFAAPALALRDTRGTEAHPFDAAAALRDLGAAVPASGSSSISPLHLFEAADPGVASPASVELVLLGLDEPVAPELAAAAPITLDTRPVALIALAASGPPAVLRADRLPYSLDFVSATPTRIRPERMGFQEDEYVIYAQPPPAGTGNPPVRLAVSVVDIDRSGPPYLLLGIQINGTPTEGGAERLRGASGGSTLPPPSGSGLSNFSENTALTSISNSLDPARDRQLIRATAYVQLGNDGKALRLLDRQDDRNPVFYPTGMHVNWVRFVVLRPDGTPYNFHGRRTMVALRFLGYPDNPNFLAAGSA
jgi:hypothetical protein